MRLRKALAVTILFAATTFAAYAPSIRTDNNTDMLLVRLSTRSGVPLPASFYSKPMKSAEVLKFVTSCDSAIGTWFTPAERTQIDRLVRKLTGARNLYAFNKADHDINSYLDLSLLGTGKASTVDTKNNTRLAGRGTINPEFAGHLRNLSFYTDISVWSDYDNDTSYPRSSYQPYNGDPYNLYGRSTKTSTIRSSDIFRGGISLDMKRISLEMGIDHISSGPAQLYQVTWSDSAAPALYARTIMHLGAFEYVHTVGRLYMQRELPKYFYTHRLQVPLFKKHLVFGINEMILYGSTSAQTQTDSLRPDYYGETRTWEPIYFIPFVPFSFAQHYLGDRDNAAISFDADLHLPLNLRFFGEALIDDISAPWTILSNDWGNKWAVSAGAQWFGTLASHRVDLSAEYERIRPWVGTHFYGGSHNMENYGQPIGAQIGPNADAGTFKITTDINRMFNVGVYVTASRKGKGRGSSLTDVFQDSGRTTKADTTKVAFLAGGHTTTEIGGLTVRFTPVEIFTVNADLNIDNKKRPTFSIGGGFSF